MKRQKVKVFLNIQEDGYCVPNITYMVYSVKSCIVRNAMKSSKWKFKQLPQTVCLKMLTGTHYLDVQWLNFYFIPQIPSSHGN